MELHEELNYFIGLIHSMNNSSTLNRMMNWLSTDAQATAAPSRHITSLCLLSRGLQQCGADAF
jgi:hypothetical protein